MQIKQEKKWWIDNREMIVNALYQKLLLDYNKENIEQILLDTNYTNEQIAIVKDIIEHEEMIIETLSKFLDNDWSFERLHFLSKAILISSAYEMLILKKPKAIIVNTYVEISKKISDLKTSKLINALLDKIV